MKRRVQRVLQRLLGFDRYLVLFALVSSATLRWSRNERDVLHFIELLPSDAVVLDIGANIGIITARLGRRVRTGEVHCYEPVPDNQRALRRVVDRLRLRNVTIHPVALGDRAGEVEMVMPTQEQVRMQGLSHVVGATGEDPEEGVRYTVPVRCLDDDPALAGRRVDGIKMDVENFEYRVLLGARELLERDRPVIYTELWDNEVRTECFELVGSLGYSVRVLEAGRLVPFEPGRHHQHNFFLCPSAA